MSRFQIIQSLLRESAGHSIDAARWFDVYEKSANPAHRRNALLALMDARDTMQRAEAAITRELDLPAQVAS